MDVFFFATGKKRNKKVYKLSQLGSKFPKATFCQQQKMHTAINKVTETNITYEQLVSMPPLQITMETNKHVETILPASNSKCKFKWHVSVGLIA